MPAPKKPQDHKAPAAAGYQFEWQGKTYTLPPASQAREALPGRVLRDAVLEDGGDLKLMFLALEAVDPGEGVLDALYSMPSSETLRIGLDWFGNSVDESGATLPQS